MKLDRIMIAAPKSGSGKTMVTCALLELLKEKGKRAVSYKCGPDYIDPMFHETVLNIPSANLDTFFTGEKETKALFLRDRTEEDFAVLEGVMGLYDGVGGVEEEGSSYHLAKLTKTPVILVVDAKGMGRSLIPLVAGFLAYDTERLIKGVILNKMSKAYYEKIKSLMEKELKISVFGFFEEQKGISVESRHLGLRLPCELLDLKKQIRLAAESLEKTVSLEQLIRTAEAAEPLEANECGKKIGGMETAEADRAGRVGGIIPVGEPERNSEAQAIRHMAGPVISREPLVAVARDEVFCFYYKENLRLLQACGVKLEYFSPLHDKTLPRGCKGILLGGGYPEEAAEELSGNREMLAAVRKAINSGIPSVAECGGFLYLHSGLTDRNGRHYRMAGVIDAECYDTGRPVRFGYVEIEGKNGYFLPEGKRIRGHEFHYYDSGNNGSDCLAIKPGSGKTYPCIVEGKYYWWGFPHLYYPSNPSFAMAFAEKVKKSL